MIIEWGNDEDALLELARICFAHGCWFVPVQSDEHARRIATAFLAPLGGSRMVA